MTYKIRILIGTLLLTTGVAIMPRPIRKHFRKAIVTARKRLEFRMTELKNKALSVGSGIDDKIICSCPTCNSGYIYHYAISSEFKCNICKSSWRSFVNKNISIKQKGSE